MVAGVVVGGGEADGGLLDGQGAVGLEREAHIRADHQYVLHEERQADGEPQVDNPVAKGRAEEVEGDQTRLLDVLDMRWLLPDDAWRCVEEVR